LGRGGVLYLNWGGVFKPPSGVYKYHSTVVLVTTVTYMYILITIVAIH